MTGLGFQHLKSFSLDLEGTRKDGTALYVGYNNILENYDRLALAHGDALERARTGMLSTAAGLFVKPSYLSQF